MNITPIAYFRSPLKEKFGVPRQSGIATQLHGRIVLQNEWNDPECLRGLEDFDYLWILWGFSANVDAPKHATVRPPRLGGNRRMGVFATRSSFRPNNIGMSAVRIVGIHKGTNVEIEVSGADLMDGTPIYDIKPYLPEFDAHPEARGGFASSEKWTTLNVDIPDAFALARNSAYSLSNCLPRTLVPIITTIPKGYMEWLSADITLSSKLSIILQKLSILTCFKSRI